MNSPKHILKRYNLFHHQKLKRCKQGIMLASRRVVYFFLFLAAGATQAQPFITTWKTDNPGISAIYQIAVPIIAVSCNQILDRAHITNNYYPEPTVLPEMSCSLPRYFHSFSSDFYV